MDRYWFLSNTCYGNWLPGDARGFVGRVWEHRGDDPFHEPRNAHASAGAEYDENMPGLTWAAQTLLKGAPIHLDVAHAEVLLGQFQETATHRGWELRAVAIMFNHFHRGGRPGGPEAIEDPGRLQELGNADADRGVRSANFRDVVDRARLQA